MKVSILSLTLFFILFVVACQRQQPGAPAPTTPGAGESGAPLPDGDAGSVLAGGVAAGMATPTPGEPAPTAEATATPVPAVELTVCMAAEPANLYLYGDTSLWATAVRHAIYENLYTTRAYGYQAQGLERLPDLAGGDVALRDVEVVEGDRVVDAAGTVIELRRRATVVNVAGEIVVFDGTPILMQQMTVDFSFKPLVWSDGTPVSAADSVFSFTIAADPATPVNKHKIERTAEYVATGALTLRWRGLPGYVDATYVSNVWPPLPRHQLQGYSAGELLNVPEANVEPLSHGPFVMSAWTQGEQLVLERNPHYYRAGEGLPRLDRVVFKVVTEVESLSDALPGCDVVTHDVFDSAEDLHVSFLDEAGAQGLLTPHVQTRTIFEHIAFGINPVDSYAITRPNWFNRVRVRQAIAMCIDRQRLVDELLFGRSQVVDAYIPRDHPLFPEDVTGWPYDPAAANALLDEAGYLDLDGNGIRQEPERGRSFRITLGSDSESELRRRVSEIVRDNLQACGIAVELYTAPAQEWYAPGPDGPLFGRRFDLGTFAWFTGVQPPCHLYLSRNVTGPEAEGFGGWGNVNETGWASADYDAACEAALRAVPGTPEYEENHRQAVRVFAGQLPVVPLFLRLQAAAARPNVLNFSLDPTQTSELWNLYELDLVRP